MLRLDYDPILKRRPDTGILLSRGLRAWKLLEGGSKVEIGVKLVGRRDMATYNLQYRGKSGATDILTFPYFQQGELIGGDILLCMPLARMQARIRRVGLLDELLRLIVHGMVHLLGYDHHTVRDFMRMRKLEFVILSQIVS